MNPTSPFSLCVTAIVGLSLLGLSSGTKFVVTAGVLLLAVTVDSLATRGRASSGRA